MEKLKLTDVSEEVATAIRMEMRRFEYKPVFICRTSEHPDDKYLYSVIGEYTGTAPRSIDTYVCWEFNAGIGGLFWGHYDLNLKQALEIMAEKLNTIK